MSNLTEQQVTTQFANLPFVLRDFVEDSDTRAIYYYNFTPPEPGDEETDSQSAYNYKLFLMYQDAFADLYQDFNDIMEAHTLDYATGKSLKYWGRFLKRGCRVGESDENYRWRLRLWRKVLNSDSIAPHIVQILMIYILHSFTLSREDEFWFLPNHNTHDTRPDAPAIPQYYQFTIPADLIPFTRSGTNYTSSSLPTAQIDPADRYGRGRYSQDVDVSFIKALVELANLISAAGWEDLIYARWWDHDYGSIAQPQAIYGQSLYSGAIEPMIALDINADTGLLL